MTKKSVLFIDQYASVGGGQSVLFDVIQVFVQADWNVKVLAPMGGELESQLQERFSDRITIANLDVPLLSIGKKTLTDVLRLFSPLRQLLLRRKELATFDLIYVNGARLFPLVGLVSLIVRAKFIYHIHLDHSRGQKLILATLSRLPRTLFLLTNSKFVSEQLKPAFAIQLKKLRELGCSLSPQMTEIPFQDRVSKKLQRKVCVVIGRLSYEKGQDRVCEAAKQLPEIDFYFIGGTDFQDRKFLDLLKDRAPENVRFLGKSDNVIQSLDQLAPVFSVVPSRWQEPFGLVAIESMAMSALTLTSGQGGLREIADSTGSFVFADVDDLVRQLKDLQTLSDESLLALSREQYERTIATYAWPVFRDRLLGFINSANWGAE